MCSTISPRAKHNLYTLQYFDIFLQCVKPFIYMYIDIHKKNVIVITFELILNFLLGKNSLFYCLLDHTNHEFSLQTFAKLSIGLHMWIYIFLITCVSQMFYEKNAAINILPTFTAYSVWFSRFLYVCTEA